MDNNNKWDELSLTEKSEIMRQAVANGIINLNEIRQTYNEYANGGSMDNGITENKEAVAAAKEKYPMLRGLDFSVYSDPNYRASDYDGYGDIEVFHKGEQKIDYTPEYSYPNPNINQDNVLYNPDRIPEGYTQDAINLDAISHLGHNDPTYDTLNATIGNEYPDAATSEMLPLYEKMTGKNLMKMPDSKRPTKDKWIPQVLEAWDDAPQRYQNAIDGLVRDYIISKEHPNPNDPIYKGLNYVKYNPQWDSENNSPFYLNQLYDYITTGRKPANILPEVTVTSHKHAGGGKVAHDARYNHATQIYQSYVNQGVNPQTALELTNQKIAEKGWTGWVSGDNKRYSDVNSFTDHTINQFNRLYPDSLKSNNFNQFFQGIEGGRTKYNPTPNIYRQHLLQTRPGVKKRINEYRRLQGQSPLSLVSPTSTPLPWEEGILYNPQLPLEVPTEQPVIVADGGYLYARGGKLSQQNQRAGYAVDYFMNKGLSREAAAGLVGNLMRESHMNTNAINPASGAYGLGQWLGSRKTKLFKKYGRNPSFYQQLDYIWDELNTSHRKGLQMLKSSKTVDEAARNAFGYYEFSAGPQAAIAAMNKNGKNTKWKNPNGTVAMNDGITNAWVAYGKANPNAKFQGLNINAPVLGYNRTIPNYDFTSAVDGLDVEDSIANFSGETPKFQYDLLPPNPTDYGTPINWSTPEKKAETPTITPKEDNNELGLLALINQIYDSPKQEPLATYTPQKNNSMFVVSAPTSDDTFLNSSWFKEGGYLYGDGGDTINHKFTYDNTVNYNGSEYPTSNMLVDGKDRQVFADGEGGVWTMVDGSPKRVNFQHNLPEVVVKPQISDIIQKQIDDYLTTSNDATAVGNPSNAHLKDRGIYGAMAHAAWEKEHPNLAAWSYVTAAAPFAVAAYPFMAGASDALVSTALGEGITSGLSTISSAAKGSTWLPWLDAGTTSYFGAKGINDIANGIFTPETAMEVAPIAQMFKPLTYSVRNATDNLERRAMEIGMRTTPIYNPLPSMKDGAITMLKGQNGGKRRMAHIMDYLFTGHKVGPKGYYNSLAPFTPYNEADLISNPSFIQRWDSFIHPIGSSRAYSGFLNGAGSTPEMWERNDLIDAYLYNKPIDSSFGMKRVATGSDFGAHDKYIAQNYPQKAKDIPVYQTTSLNQYPDKDVMTNGIWENADNGLFGTGNGTDYVNAAGHIYTTGETPNGTPLVKQQDLWKFNQDYVDKWLKSEREKSGRKPFTPLELSAFRYALKEMDRLGTPIITRTEWMPEDLATMSTK